MRELQTFINEKAPPSAKYEQWIKDNKEKFKEQYGADWEEILYAVAWKMYNKDKD